MTRGVISASTRRAIRARTTRFVQKPGGLARLLAIDVAPELLRPYETRSDVTLIVTRYALLDATLLAQVMPVSERKTT